MPVDTVAAYAIAIASVSSIVVQAIKVLFIDPKWTDGPQRNMALYVFNYACNFGFLALVLITHNAWVWSDLFDYIALATGQAIGSHLGFQTLKYAPDSKMIQQMRQQIQQIAPKDPPNVAQ